MPEKGQVVELKTVSTKVDIDTYYELKIAALKARMEQQAFYRAVMEKALITEGFLTDIKPA